MKKTVMFAVFAVLFAGCASTEYHNGRKNFGIATPDTITVLPMQAEMEVGEKISGAAECETWLGIFHRYPEKQTYGMALYPEDGNFAPNQCTKGAFYDALSKSKADTIVAPKYTSEKKRELCIFGIKFLCLHVMDQTVVTGYKGTIKNIRTIDKDLLDFKWKADALKN